MAVNIVYKLTSSGISVNYETESNSVEHLATLMGL